MNSQTVNFKLQSYTTPDLIPDLVLATCEAAIYQ